MTKNTRNTKNTRRKHGGSSYTRKSLVNNGNNNKKILQNFEKEITVYFFEMLLLIKLFHWKTYSYSIHKATDELYTRFNEHMDKFIEVLLGKTGMRIDLITKKQINLYDLSNTSQLINKINEFKRYLVDLNSNKAMKVMSNYDLLTIRDEILADMNQFLYLLSFK